jgi:hypothetical protein
VRDEIRWGLGPPLMSRLHVCRLASGAGRVEICSKAFFEGAALRQKAPSSNGVVYVLTAERSAGKWDLQAEQKR